MSVGNYTSFNGAVEKAIAKAQLSPAERKAAERLAQLSPAERKIQRQLDRKRAAANSKPKPKPNTNLSGPKSNTNLSGPKSNTGLSKPTPRAGGGGGMRRAKGRVINTVADDVVKKIGGKYAQTGRGAAALKGFGKVAVPLAAAEQAYQTAKLIGSEEARDRATQEYADSANEGALMRTIKGGLGGVKTIYGAASNLAALGESLVRGSESQRAYEEKLKDPKVQEALQSAKAIQNAYAKLPADEQAKVDAMKGRDATQYLRDKLNPPSMGKKPPSFVRPRIPKAIPKAIPVVPDPNPEFAQAYRDASPEEKQRMRQEGPSAEPDMDRALALFQNTHGGPFDPKSSMDKGKMDVIKNLMAQKGSERLTPNQFSLQIYRRS